MFSYDGSVDSGEQGEFDFDSTKHSLEDRASLPPKRRLPRLDTKFDFRSFGEEVEGRDFRPKDYYFDPGAKAKVLMRHGLGRLRISRGRSVSTSSANAERIGKAFESCWNGYLKRKEAYGWGSGEEE